MIFRLTLLLFLLFPSISWAVPNIIVIHIGDDIHKDAISEHTLTALDTMAAAGVSFSNFYTQTVCSPSRAELFGFGHIGQVNNHLGYLVDMNIPPTSLLELSVGSETIISVFKKAGYQVAGFGKLHLGREQGANFDKPTFAKQIGFDYYKAMLLANDGQAFACASLRTNATTCWGHNYWCNYSLDGTYEISGNGLSVSGASNKYVNKVIESEVTTYIATLDLATDKRLIIIGWQAPHGTWKDGDNDGGAADCDYDDNGSDEGFRDDRPPDGSSDDDGVGTPPTLPGYKEQIEDLSVRIGTINGLLNLASGGNDHLAMFIGDNGSPTGGAGANCTASPGVKGTVYPCGVNTMLIMQGDTVGGAGVTITGLFRMTDVPASLAILAGTNTTRSGTYSFDACVTAGDSACTSRPYILARRYGSVMGGATGSDSTPIGTNPFPPTYGDNAAEWSVNINGAFTDQVGGKLFFLERVQDEDDVISAADVCENFYEVTGGRPYLLDSEQIANSNCSTFDGTISVGGLTDEQLEAYIILKAAIDQRSISPEPRVTLRGAGF